MKSKLKHLILDAVAALAGACRGLRLAANTYDAAVKTHDCTITRTNDVAITTRHLLWATGAAAGGVKICTAADVPLGTIDNVTTTVGARQSILLLGKGATKKMVANEAITEGELVFAAAGGKVQDLPTGTGNYYCIGVAVTAAAADGDIIEVADCAASLTRV